MKKPVCSNCIGSNQFIFTGDILFSMKTQTYSIQDADKLRNTCQLCGATNTLEWVEYGQLEQIKEVVQEYISDMPNHETLSPKDYLKRQNRFVNKIIDILEGDK